MNQEAAATDADSAGSLTLGFPACSTVGNEFLWFIRHLACGALLRQPTQTVTTSHHGTGRKEGSSGDYDELVPGGTMASDSRNEGRAAGLLPALPDKCFSLQLAQPP